jgi:hypothetical protein
MYSVHDLLTEGFPHSDIRGSTIARISPRLFAACHVLHRLLAPRHPPNALLLLSNPSTARAQDQTAPRISPPARLYPCASGAGTTHASANFTHISDRQPNPIAKPPQKGMPQPKGQIIHPPDPIHRLKEHAQTSQRPSQESRAREARNPPNLRTRSTMEASGFEPLTPCLQSRCSTS